MSQVKIISNIQEVKSRNGYILTITNTENQKIKDLSNVIIKVPDISEQLSPLFDGSILVRSHHDCSFFIIIVSTAFIF